MGDLLIKYVQVFPASKSVSIMTLMVVLHMDNTLSLLAPGEYTNKQEYISITAVLLLDHPISKRFKNHIRDTLVKHGDVQAIKKALKPCTRTL